MAPRYPKIHLVHPRAPGHGACGQTRPLLLTPFLAHTECSLCRTGFYAQTAPKEPEFAPICRAHGRFPSLSPAELACVPHGPGWDAVRRVLDRVSIYRCVPRALAPQVEFLRRRGLRLPPFGHLWDLE